MEAIICAVITGVVTLVVSLITTSAQHAKTMAEVKKDIQYLTEKVEKHNRLIERTYQLEEKVAILEATCPVKHSSKEK